MRNRNKSVKRTCQECGAKFLVEPNQAKKKGKALYCSHDCRNKTGGRSMRRKYPVWRAKNLKLAYSSRKAVHKAIKNGMLTRMPCEECAVEPAQAHHSDYSKPLDVKWLCAKHHGEFHFKAGRDLL